MSKPRKTKPGAKTRISKPAAKPHKAKPTSKSHHLESAARPRNTVAYKDRMTNPMRRKWESNAAKLTRVAFTREALTPEEEIAADCNGQIRVELAFENFNLPEAKEIAGWVLGHLTEARPGGATFREIVQEARTQFPQLLPDSFKNAFILLDAFGHIGVDGMPGPFCLGRSVEVARALLDSHNGLWTAMQG